MQGLNIIGKYTKEPFWKVLGSSIFLFDIQVRFGRFKGTPGKMKRRGGKILTYIVVWIAIIVVAVPFYWLVATAFKPGWAVTQRPPLLIPPYLSLENFTQSLFGSVQFSGAVRSIIDSLIVGLGNTALSLVVGLLASYSIARFKTGGYYLSLWILSNRFLPPIIFIVPLFIIFRAVRLFDTHLGLIIAHCTFNIPFAVWMLIGFIQGIPETLEEAALIDGCSRIGAFLRITVPAIAPGIVVTALFCFLFSWNEYIMALLLTGRKIQTLPVVIPKYRGAFDILYGNISAVALLAIMPAIILAFILQKHIVKGLTVGALKG